MPLLSHCEIYMSGFYKLGNRRWTVASGEGQVGADFKRDKVLKMAYRGVLSVGSKRAWQLYLHPGKIIERS